jgi:hypothetical protein
MKRILQFYFIAIFTFTLHAQGNVGIGTNTPNDGAVLDITASNKGLLIPRVALTLPTTWGLAGTATESMLVYNTATVPGIGNINFLSPGYYYWNVPLNMWVRLIALPDGNVLAWSLLGNSSTIQPGLPTTYGTTLINTALLGENFIGTSDAKDFVIGTNKIERARFKTGSAGTGGNLVLGQTTATDASYLVNLATTTANTGLKGGIDMQLNNNLSAQGLNINIGTSATNVNGILATHNSGSLSTTLYTVGGVLNNANIVSGYLGYRNGSGKSYGVYGINGILGTYATNANTWAGYFNGRTVITSDNSPTSPLGVDLEVQNTTAGVGNAATVQLRQTTANTTANSTLANINFGDATVTTPQAQINVTRDAASSGSTDLPTRMTFSTTPDGSATLTERMRIDNVGNVGINTVPTDRFQVLPTGGKDVLLGGGAITGSELKLTNGGTSHFSIYNSGNQKLTIAQTSGTFATNTAGTSLMTLDNAGVVTIAQQLYAKQMHMSYHNFNQGTWSGTAWNGTCYIPSNGEGGTDDYYTSSGGLYGMGNDYRRTWVAPYNGRLIKIIVRVGSNSGTNPQLLARPVISINGTPSTLDAGTSGSISVNDNAFATYIPSQNNSFSRGDRLAVGFYFNCTSCRMEDTDYFVTCVWEYDIKD